MQNDHQRLKALIIEEILPTYAIKHIWSSVQRIFILIPGLKGLIVVSVRAYCRCYFCYQCMCVYFTAGLFKTNKSEEVTLLVNLSKVFFFNFHETESQFTLSNY